MPALMVIGSATPPGLSKWILPIRCCTRSTVACARATSAPGMMIMNSSPLSRPTTSPGSTAAAVTPATVLSSSSHRGGPTVSFRSWKLSRSTTATAVCDGPPSPNNSSSA